MKRILILRPGALGDFILTLPVIRSIRRSFPDSIIEVMAPNFAKEILLQQKFVNKWSTYDPPGLHTFFDRALKPDPKICEYFEGFDWILSYWSDSNGVFQKQLSRCLQGTLSTHQPIPSHKTPEHVSLYLAKPLKDQGIPFQIEHPLIPSCDNESNAWKTFQGDIGFTKSKPIILIHPGSGSPKKNWPSRSFAELCYRINKADQFLPVLIQGPADEESANTIQAALGQKSFPWWVCPQLTDLMGVFRKVAGYVGNDSGISHLAAATGCPTIAIFGPTNPIQWMPLGARVKVLGGNRKMSAVTIEEVLTAIHALFAV